MGLGLGEERAVQLVHRQVHEREQQAEQHVRAERAEHRLVGDLPLAQDAAERDGQRGRHEQRDRQQIGQADQRGAADEQDDRREHRARPDQHPVAAGDLVPGLGIADRDEQRRGSEQRATGRAPARIVDDLEQQEVREQQRQQARVAVDEADDVAALGRRRCVLWTPCIPRG